MKVAYVRVSTAEQNESRQLEALEKYEVQCTFIADLDLGDTEKRKIREICKQKGIQITLVA